MSEPGGTWRHPHPRGLLATALGLAGVGIVAGVPTALGIARDAGPAVALSWVVACALLLVAAGVGIDLVRCRRTAYRLTPELLEVETTWFSHRRRALRRDRIRVVDVTADPVSPLLRLVSVQIGTGEQGSPPVRLWALSAEDGRALRAALLTRADADTADTGGEDGVLATTSPARAAYGVASFLTPALGAAAVGGVSTVSGWFGLSEAVTAWLGRRAGELGLPVAIGAALALLLVVGAVGALAVSVETWWSHRLVRGGDGVLQVRRGLLTTRSISIEERRLRGIELVEPAGVRCLGAARVDALVTGMRDTDEDRAEDTTLVPSAPRGTALATAARVLGTQAPLAAPLVAHPLAARRRRRVWALGVVAVLVAAVASLGVVVAGAWFAVAGALAALGVPVALVVARASHRALGHAVTPGHLVVRHGVVRRTTAVLRRDAVIGWAIRSGPAQRRYGLVTLVAATATTAGSCVLHDVAADDAVALARAVAPDGLAPFVDRVAPRGVRDAGSGSSTSPRPAGAPARR